MPRHYPSRMHPRMFWRSSGFGRLPQWSTQKTETCGNGNLQQRPNKYRIRLSEYRREPTHHGGDMSDFQKTVWSDASKADYFMNNASRYIPDRVATHSILA